MEGRDLEGTKYVEIQLRKDSIKFTQPTKFKEEAGKPTPFYNPDALFYLLHHLEHHPDDHCLLYQALAAPRQEKGSERRKASTQKRGQPSPNLSKRSVF